MTFNRITESESKYDHLEKISIRELLENINREDKSVPLAIEKVIPAIEKLVDAIVLQIKIGGKFLYRGELFVKTTSEPGIFAK